MNTTRRNLMLACALAIATTVSGLATAADAHDSPATISTSATRVQLAPIRSRADLVRFLASPAASRSPLARMSILGKKRFLAGLTFNERGLTGYRFTDLEAELSPSDIYRVLSLFGAEHTTPLLDRAQARDATDRLVLGGAGGPAAPSLLQAERQGDESIKAQTDYKWMKCVKRATCQSNDDYICMSSC